MDGLDPVAGLPCQSEKEHLKYEQQGNIRILTHPYTHTHIREGLQISAGPTLLGALSKTL